MQNKSCQTPKSQSFEGLKAQLSSLILLGKLICLLNFTKITVMEQLWANFLVDFVEHHRSLRQLHLLYHLHLLPHLTVHLGVNWLIQYHCSPLHNRYSRLQLIHLLHHVLLMLIFHQHHHHSVHFLHLPPHFHRHPLLDRHLQQLFYHFHQCLLALGQIHSQVHHLLRLPAHYHHCHRYLPLLLRHLHHRYLDFV